MEKDELADVINIASEILEIIKNGNIELRHFEEWYNVLMNKYNDKDKALRIIDQAVTRFLILYREEKKKEGFAVSNNVKIED